MLTQVLPCKLPTVRYMEGVMLWLLGGLAYLFRVIADFERIAIERGIWELVDPVAKYHHAWPVGHGDVFYRVEVPEYIITYVGRDDENSSMYRCIPL